MIKKLKDEEELKNIILKEKIVFIKFFTTYCGPCKTLAPEFMKYAEFHREDATFVEFNAEDLEDLAYYDNLNVVPKICAFVHGKLVTSKNGYQTFESLKEHFDIYLKK